MFQKTNFVEDPLNGYMEAVYIIQLTLAERTTSCNLEAFIRYHSGFDRNEVGHCLRRCKINNMSNNISAPFISRWFD